MGRLTILNYHNVALAPPGAQLTKLYVSPEEFERQCWLLRRLGLQGVSLTEGLQALQAGEAGRCVVFTFDDGYTDNLTQAAPILRKFGFTATCYVVSGRLGEHNVWDAELLKVKKPLMNRGELQAWLAAGHEIGSHTVTHPRLGQISAEQAITEIYESRSQLTELTGAAIQHFCYPYGEYTAETLELVRAAGYRSAVTTQRGLATSADDLLRLPRVSVNGGKGLFKFALKAATPYADFGRRRAA